MKNQPTVDIAVPTYSGRVHHLFLRSIVALGKPKGSGLIVIPGTAIHHARNRSVEFHLKNGKDYLLFIDDDMVFEPDALQRLLEADKDIICGMAFMRVSPFYPCVYNFDKNAQIGKRYTPIVPSAKSELIKAGGCGMFFTLIKRKVFEKLKEPYFWFEGEQGEDLYFCRKALEAGFEIWCDARVKVGHISEPEVIYSNKFFEYNKSLIEKAGLTPVDSQTGKKLK